MTVNLINSIEAFRAQEKARIHQFVNQHPVWKHDSLMAKELQKLEQVIEGKKIALLGLTTSDDTPINTSMQDEKGSESPLNGLASTDPKPDTPAAPEVIAETPQTVVEAPVAEAPKLQALDVHIHANEGQQG